MDEALTQAWSDLVAKLEGWVTSLVTNLPEIILAVLVFVGMLFLGRWMKKYVYRATKAFSSQETIRKMIASLTTVVIALIGLFLALGILDLNKMLNSLLASAGVAGLAIGLALQGTLTNTLSGIILSMKDVVNMGDFIESNGYKGRIRRIGLRHLVIQESDNNMVMIPNSEVIENPMKNYTLTPTTKVFLKCGVHYSSDLGRVEEIVTEVIKGLDIIQRPEDFNFYFYEFGDSSINFEIRFHARCATALDEMLAKNKAVQAIKKRFDEEGITIPFPIRTLEFANRLDLERGSEGEKMKNEE